MEPEFKAFGKILHINKLYMSITQKIHGSNAQIYIEDIGCGHIVKAGSRSRYLTLETDVPLDEVVLASTEDSAVNKAEKILMKKIGINAFDILDTEYYAEEIE